MNDDFPTRQKVKVEPDQCHKCGIKLSALPESNTLYIW